MITSPCFLKLGIEEDKTISFEIPNLYLPFIFVISIWTYGYDFPPQLEGRTRLP